MFCFFRSVVVRPDSHTAPAGEHLWVREGRGERGAELHELPDGPASFHHGDLRSSAAALWHLSHHLCAVHHHRSHHVLPICAQSQEKTPPQHIGEWSWPTRTPRPEMLISSDSTLHLWNECLPSPSPSPSSFSNLIAIVHSQFSHSFSVQHSLFQSLLLACRATSQSGKQDLRWGRMGDMFPPGAYQTKSSGACRWKTLIP